MAKARKDSHCSQISIVHNCHQYNFLPFVNTDIKPRAKLQFPKIPACGSGLNVLSFPPMTRHERQIPRNGKAEGRTPFQILDGWMALHEEEAYAAWNLAVQGKPFEKIVPAM